MIHMTLPRVWVKLERMCHVWETSDLCKRCGKHDTNNPPKGAFIHRRVLAPCCSQPFSATCSKISKYWTLQRWDLAHFISRYVKILADTWKRSLETFNLYPVRHVAGMLQKPALLHPGFGGISGASAAGCATSSARCMGDVSGWCRGVKQWNSRRGYAQAPRDLDRYI